jgi:hypothetical protein
MPSAGESTGSPAFSARCSVGAPSGSTATTLIGLDADDVNAAAVPGGDAADQPAAADRDQQRIDLRRIAFDLQPDRALPEQRFRLVERMHWQRTRLRHELFAGRQRIGIAIAGDDQLGSVAADQCNLRRRRHFRQKDRRFYAARLRRIGNRNAMIAAGSGHHTRLADFARQQVGERTTHLERPGVLQAFEFQLQRPRRQTELGGINDDGRGVPDIGPDQRLVARNRIAGDGGGSQHERLSTRIDRGLAI